MAEIDTFAITLLEEAKRFLEQAKDHGDAEGKAAYLHAALMVGFCAFEAHINSVCADFVDRSDLSPHDKAVLAERDVRLENGRFEMAKGLKMYRMEDRIQFLHQRLSGTPVNRLDTWWTALMASIDLRNQITHPKKCSHYY